MGTKTVDEAGTSEAAEVKHDEEAVDATGTEATAEEEQSGAGEVLASGAEEEPSGVGQGAGAVVSAALGVVSLTGSWVGTVASARQSLIGQLHAQTATSSNVGKLLKEGYAQVLVQSDRTPGTVTLSATARGLAPANIVIRTASSP